MKNEFRRAALYAALLSLLPAGFAAAQTKKIVKTQDDLPRFTYPISGTATELVTSDDATFHVFAAKVRHDVDSVLDNYDIQDRATLRGLLDVKLALEMLSGTEDVQARETLAKLKDLEDKPDAKLLSGLTMTAMLDAHAQTGKTSGPEYAQAFAKDYAAAVDPLPWAIVGNRVKEAKSSAEIHGKPLLLGIVKARIEPAVAKSHELSSDLAWSLIGIRESLVQTLPLRDELIAVLNKDVAAHDTQKPDIWASRSVTLTDADKLTPVRVAIWDSGSDIALFPGRVYTDPHPTATTDPHGLAFDLKGDVAHGYLVPLTDAQKTEYAEVRGDLKGFSDLQASIDSPEASGLKKKLSTMSPAEIPAFLEKIEFYDNYSHGTHVAGIAAKGNPAIRLAAARITFDWHNVPLKPTEELAEKTAADDKAYVAWFVAHGIRVVNMSWGGGPKDYEDALEKNGVANAAERKTLAKKLFTIERDGLYEAIKSASDVLFICAAGNADSDSGFNEMIPSSFKLPNLLVVGAVDQAGDETSFTSYGDTVLVDANGYQVESTIPGGSMLKMSGTSMASPNTVNLAAKLLAIDPKLTPEQVIHLIVAGATPSADGRRHNIDEKTSIAMLYAQMK